MENGNVYIYSDGIFFLRARPSVPSGPLIITVMIFTVLVLFAVYFAFSFFHMLFINTEFDLTNISSYILERLLFLFILVCTVIFYLYFVILKKIMIYTFYTDSDFFCIRRSIAFIKFERKCPLSDISVTRAFHKSFSMHKILTKEIPVYTLNYRDKSLLLNYIFFNYQQIDWLYTKLSVMLDDYKSGSFSPAGQKVS